MPSSEPMTRGYRVALGALSPVVRRWGRLEVAGLEHLPETGPVLLAGNHDSHWDPVMIGVAARFSKRQIRALAKSELWQVPRPGADPERDGAGPDRARQGRQAERWTSRSKTLRAGRLHRRLPRKGPARRGKVLRARSGLGRLALEVPEAHITLGSQSQGTLGLTELSPRRPPPPRPASSTRWAVNPDRTRTTGAEELSARLLAEIREQVPRDPAGRRRKAARRARAAADGG